MPDLWTRCGMAGLEFADERGAVHTPSERVADLRWIAPGQTRPMRHDSALWTPGRPE